MIIREGGAGIKEFLNPGDRPSPRRKQGIHGPDLARTAGSRFGRARGASKGFMAQTSLALRARSLE